ncbi:MAG TPA: caspase family protein [Bacteroidia bacterium]|jgi:hypothetical protein|nr:caspase family protein [Bacteroidia bacterium]
MKRKALIVYCDNTPSGHLAGTVMDAHNINSYLKSIAGGEWRTDEIGFLRNPTSIKLRRAVNFFMKDSDYTFIVFSGHGFMNLNDGGKQYLELYDANVPITRLVTNALKQTIIVDACRNYYSAHRERLTEEYSSFIGDIEHLERPSTRHIFDSAVRKAGKGISVLYSSSRKENALDTPSGGAFLFSLLSYAQFWSTTNSHFTYLPVNSALQRATTLMYQKFDTTQKPVMNKRTGVYHFPLAVKLPSYPSWLKLR